jgi:hypothetical protein
MEKEIEFDDNGYEYCDDCGYCTCCCMCDVGMIYQEDEEETSAQ